MLARMLNLLPRRDIADNDGTLYLQRWTLLRAFGRKVMLHRILKPDDDREPHDHPWPFITVVLWGGYVEIVRRFPIPDDPHVRRLEDRVMKQAGLRRDWIRVNLWAAVRYNNPHHTHRIERLMGNSCWTLVLRGRRRREWGFNTDCGWMQWRRFIDKKRRGAPICEE